MADDQESTDHKGDFWAVLADALRELGSANDAEDRGYVREAAQMRERSRVLITSLLAQHPEIGIRFPTLAGDIYNPYSERWSYYADQLRRPYGSP